MNNDMQTKCQSGYSLIELIVYLGVISLLIPISMTWFTDMFQSIYQKGNACNKTINYVLMHDLLTRDLHLAPCEVSAWKRIKDSVLIWKDEHSDIGWSIEKEKLVRVQGEYDDFRRIWKKRTTSTVLQSLKNFTFDVVYFSEKKELIKGVTITLIPDHDNQPIQFFVALNPRRVDVCAQTT